MPEADRSPSESALLHLEEEFEEGGNILEESLLGDGASASAQGVPELNDAEAGNVAFIVSDRIARRNELHMMGDDSIAEKDMVLLAEKIARRLDRLSLRLGGSLGR